MPKQPFLLRLIIYIIVFLLLITFLIKFFSNLPQSHFSFDFRNAKKLNDLQTIITSIEKPEGNYAFFVQDLTTGEKYGYQENTPIPAASLYKLFLLAAAADEIQKGNLKEDDLLTASKDYLVDKLGSVDYGYEDAEDTISYSVKEELERIGRISDNFASIMLTDKIGAKKMADMVSKIGAKQTFLKEDPIITTASDIGLFFEVLYKASLFESKEVLSKDTAQRVIYILSLNQLNNRIPAGIAEVANSEQPKIVHKTGELAGIRNDAGIVYLASQGEAVRAYVIVLMSKDLKYEDDGVETLREVSKRVYEYFKSKAINK